MPHLCHDFYRDCQGRTSGHRLTTDVLALAIIKSGSDLQGFVKYEFVNYAPALFDSFSLSRTAKSALAQSLGVRKHAVKELNPHPSITVLDGGHLLHVAIWPSMSTEYGTVVERYVT